LFQVIWKKLRFQLFWTNLINSLQKVSKSSRKKKKKPMSVIQERQLGLRSRKLLMLSLQLKLNLSLQKGEREALNTARVKKLSKHLMIYKINPNRKFLKSNKMMKSKMWFLENQWVVNLQEVRMVKNLCKRLVPKVKFLMYQIFQTQKKLCSTKHHLKRMTEMTQMEKMNTS
jgi:hypothetical protein